MLLFLSKLNALVVMLLAALVILQSCGSNQAVSVLETSSNKNLESLPSERKIVNADQTKSVPDEEDLNEESLSSEQVGEANLDNLEYRGTLAKLSLEQSKELLNAKAETPAYKIKRQSIIVPTYIPSGFELSSLTISSYSKTYSATYYFYQIVYENNQGSCFSISQYALDEPIGEGMLEVDKIEAIESPNIELEVDLGIYGFDRSSSPKNATVLLVGEAGNYYDLNFPDHSCNEASDFSLDEAVKIINSLNYLNPQENGKLEVSNFVVSL